jgi:hypothetical protein
VTPHDETEVRVFNILRGEAEEVRRTAFGSVGTLFSGRGIECVSVSKLDEQVDPDWFSSDDVDDRRKYLRSVTLAATSARFGAAIERPSVGMRPGRALRVTLPNRYGPSDSFLASS